MFFSQDWRERIKAENPSAGFGEVGKLLGAKWKELDDEEKKVRLSTRLPRPTHLIASPSSLISNKLPKTRHAQKKKRLLTMYVPHSPSFDLVLISSSQSGKKGVASDGDKDEDEDEE